MRKGAEPISEIIVSLTFIGVEDQLLHNLGSWKFNNVSDVSGISGNKGKGLGVIPADFDQDGDS